MDATHLSCDDQAEPLPFVGESAASRLEQHEILVFDTCPFPLSPRDDLDFLRSQRLNGRYHKNISFDPVLHRAFGFQPLPLIEATRLREILADFSTRATAWLATLLPSYARCWRVDRASFRPEEEATRQLRLTARNDLLHLDAFPNRPSNGWRILRLFVNLNLDEPRVWVTSWSFPHLLERYGKKVGLPGKSSLSWPHTLRREVSRLFRPGRRKRSLYDEFMLRMHDSLKRNVEFQERAPRRYHHFPPGSCWLVMSDAVSHAVLRGRFALEQTYFVPLEATCRPDASPARLLEAACGVPVLNTTEAAPRRAA
jgi:hypothetical protein